MGHLVLVPKPDWRNHGDFDLDRGYICNSDQPALTYGCFAVYRPEFFDDCKPGRFSIVPMMRRAADQRLLQGSLYEGFWSDIGTAERLLALASTKASWNTETIT
jgi:MurNAc alpha-1-phosphate uridylyltransferase